MKVHTILGTGGAIGNCLLPLLLQRQFQVRAFSRTVRHMEGVESISGDLLSYENVRNAVKNSDVVYLLAGLTYDSRVWEEKWPVIMKNVINACKESGSKLIFFDNVYMYGKVEGKTTETTPFRPISKKGEIRARIASDLLDEMKAGNIRAIIARSADFYGPHASNTSPINMLVIINLLKKTKARWIGDAEMPHSFTLTVDAARALLLLSQEEKAFGETWHMPTASPALNGKEIVTIAASSAGTKPAYSELSPFMLSMAGFFSRTIYEVKEMLYQNTGEYLFDSSKFENAFHFTPTTHEEGLRQTVNFEKARLMAM
jgi:nucleoside-diphosphate-sugar epimerase